MRADTGEKLREISGGIRGSAFPFAYHHEAELFAATAIFAPAELRTWALGKQEAPPASTRISFLGAADKPADSVAHARFSMDGRRLIFSQAGLVTVRLLGGADTDRARSVSEGATPLVAFAPRDDVLVAEGKVLRAWRLGDFADAGSPK